MKRILSIIISSLSNIPCPLLLYKVMKGNQVRIAGYPLPREFAIRMVDIRDVTDVQDYKIR